LKYCGRNRCTVIDEDGGVGMSPAEGSAIKSGTISSLLRTPFQTRGAGRSLATMAPRRTAWHGFQMCSLAGKRATGCPASYLSRRASSAVEPRTITRIVSPQILSPRPDSTIRHVCLCGPECLDQLPQALDHEGSWSVFESLRARQCLESRHRLHMRRHHFRTRSSRCYARTCMRATGSSVSRPTRLV
jgi:hypothetical protein